MPWLLALTVTGGHDIDLVYEQIPVLRGMTASIRAILVSASDKNEISYKDDLVQDCNYSIANSLELLQSCAKPSYHPFSQSPYFCCNEH